MWKSAKIGDVCDIRRGASPRPIQNFLSDKGMPWVKIADATADSSRYITETKECIIPEGVSKSLEVHPDDLIVSNSATPGLPKIMKINACIHDGWLLLSNFRGVTRDFLYYKFIDIRSHLVNQANGSVFQNLKTDIVRDFDIQIPSTAEQNNIVEILHSLDDKIELNNQINRNLEEQAKAIFNSVYDKAVNQVSFTSIISIASGGTPRTSESSFWNGNIPFFTPKDVGFPFALNTEKYITDDGLNNCNSRLYPTNTTFITARGTVGKLSLAAIPMAMNQSCFALVSERKNPILIYMYAIRAVDSLKKKSNGAVFDAITIKDFETERVNKLSDEEIKSLSSVIEPIYNQIRLNTIENHRLSDLRDSLLPKLMSGDLGV